MSADAAQEALAEAHRLLNTCLDDVDTFERDDLIKRMEDVRYILGLALRKQASLDAVVGVGADGYTFSDGSTPRARDDATLIEALEQIANPEAGRATSARMLPYEIARAALAAARAGETPE